MAKTQGAFTVLLCAGVLAGCSDDNLKTGGGLGGTLGTGGRATGGATATGAGGGQVGAGGSLTTGTTATGGNQATGGATTGTGGKLGTGGGPTSTGGRASGGTSGTVDAGIDVGATVDADCVHPPCPYLKCAAGYELSVPACGCPSCVPVDGGTPDAPICAPRICPDIVCTGGTLPNPDPCGCPICAGPDAAVVTTKPACVGLDECTCQATSGCSVLSDACYCPFPQCGNNGACVCGGGKFLGCAPAGLTTCKDAKTRVAGLCPSLTGNTWDKLCDQTDTVCATKCLNDVSACGDLFCSFCETCDCASDAFMRCVASCKAVYQPR